MKLPKTNEIQILASSNLTFPAKDQSFKKKYQKFSKIVRRKKLKNFLNNEFITTIYTRNDQLRYEHYPFF